MENSNEARVEKLKLDEATFNGMEMCVRTGSPAAPGKPCIPGSPCKPNKKLNYNFSTNYLTLTVRFFNANDKNCVARTFLRRSLVQIKINSTITRTPPTLFIQITSVAIARDYSMVWYAIDSLEGHLIGVATATLNALPHLSAFAVENAIPLCIK